MKSILTIAVLCVFTILIGTSCKKQVCGNLPGNTKVPRTIRFVLYTNKDLSDDQRNISFKLFIENSAHTILWDSLLAPMKVKDIPNPENKLVVEKVVPNDDNSLLKVGFAYTIDNAEHSRHFDSGEPGKALKIVDFNFQ